MTLHPEERRIAGLLRELIVQSGAPPETLEKRLGWEPQRLWNLLEGDLRLSFEDILEILPLLGTTPTDFFAWLYGFDSKNSVTAGAAREVGSAALAGDSLDQKTLDRRFDQSLRVVRDAISRRGDWKSQRFGEEKH
jgi:hypothetical protein